MTFEKEFPSIKDKWTIDSQTDCMVEGDIFTRWVIQEHCLDKRRVITALANAYNKGHHDRHCRFAIKECIRGIEQELGL